MESSDAADPKSQLGEFDLLRYPRDADFGGVDAAAADAAAAAAFAAALPSSSGPPSEMIYRPQGSRLLFLGGHLSSNPVDTTANRHNEAALLAGALAASAIPHTDISGPRNYDKTRARGQRQCLVCQQWFLDTPKAATEHKCPGPHSKSASDCEICGMPCGSRSAKIKHMDACPARSSVKKQQHCVRCKGWYPDLRSSLGRHMTIDCRGHPLAKNNCPTCGMGHAQPGHLKKHQNDGCPALHPQSSSFFKNIICEKCHKPFESFDAYRHHQKEGHPSKEEDPYQCRVPSCNRGFDSNSHREQHEQRAPEHIGVDLKSLVPEANPVDPTFVGMERKFWTPKEIGPGTNNPDVDDALHDCWDCGEVVDGSKAWSAHESKCPGIRCRFCAMSLSDIPGRNRHEKTCIGCPKCERRFNGINARVAREMHLETCKAGDSNTAQYDRHPWLELPSLDETIAEESAALAEAMGDEIPDFLDTVTEHERATLMGNAVQNSVNDAQNLIAKLRSESGSGNYTPMHIILPADERDRKVIRVSMSGWHPKQKPGEDRWGDKRKAKAALLADPIARFREAVATLQDESILKRLRTNSFDEIMQFISTNAANLPWFALSDRHILDMRTTVPGGRGTIYPDDGSKSRFTGYERPQRRLHNIRVHLGAVMYEHEMQRLIKDVPKEKNAPETVLEYAAMDKQVAPVVIVMGRFSNTKDPADILRQLFANYLVAEDFYTFHQNHANCIPPPSEFHSIFINGRSAADEVATVQNWTTTPEWAQIIDILNRADRQRPRPPVRIIIRGMSGYTVAARRWERTIAAWPDLDIKFLFAVRIGFIVMSPFRHMPLHGVSPRGFYYGMWYSNYVLRTADAIVRRNPTHVNVGARECNERLDEELDARTGHRFTGPDVVRIVAIRGRDRNEFW